MKRGGLEDGGLKRGGLGDLLGPLEKADEERETHRAVEAMVRVHHQRHHPAGTPPNALRLRSHEGGLEFAH